MFYRYLQISNIGASKLFAPSNIMEASTSHCSLGLSLNRLCSSESSFKNVSIYSKDERYLLQIRSGVDDITTCCQSHESYFLKSFSSSQRKCFDPLRLHKKVVTKSLRIVSENFHLRHRKKFPSLAPGLKLCTTCMKLVGKQCENQEVTEGEDGSENIGESFSIIVDELEKEKRLSNTSSEIELSINSGSSQSVLSVEKYVIVEKLNETLACIGESPLQLSKLRTATAASTKTNKIQFAIQRTMNNLLKENSESFEGGDITIDYANVGREVMSQLKEKFDSCGSYSEKLLVLSLVPKSWNLTMIQNFFGVSKYMARKSKILVEEKGILSSPNRRPGFPLSQYIVNKVTEFYESEGISREMPGAKDCLSVRENGVRVKRQKKLVLGNLKEIFEEFKVQNPDVKVGFSKFADLRPKHCVLAGSSGTHSVCVCAIHQNFKLSFEGAIKKVPSRSDSEPDLEHYRDCLNIVTCASSTEKCFFSECNKCPGVQVLRQRIEAMFDTDGVEKVKYRQWLNVDRCSLETVEKSVDAFMESFLEMVPKVLKHDFISKKQSEFLKNTKNGLDLSTVIIIADFSENYAFVLQDAVQGVHWNNRQATIHPFAGYYMKENPDRSHSICSLNFLIISDCLDHDTAAVYTFQRHLIPFLRKMVRTWNFSIFAWVFHDLNVSNYILQVLGMKKIHYFSDGATSQYKNRYNVFNLAHHEMDFGLKAEWHFFATSHGKGPSDGLGGTLKREAARASLILPSDKQIQTPTQLYEWAKSKLSGINVAYVSAIEISTTKKNLQNRFNAAPPITGIRSFHAVIPQQKCIVFKYFSSCEYDAYSCNVIFEDMKTSGENPVETR